MQVCDLVLKVMAVQCIAKKTELHCPALRKTNLFAVVAMGCRDIYSNVVSVGQ